MKKKEEDLQPLGTLERGTVSDAAKLFKVWFLEIGNAALLDDLTRLFNRRYFYHRLIQEIERIKRTRKPLSIILVDVDNFKSVNDAHGFHQGDEILHFLALLLADNLRKSDIICRYGGDTFVMILPETNLTGALVVAKRLQEKVKIHVFKAAKQDIAVHLTVSIGLANYPAEGKTPEKLLQRALLSLNKAKVRGPNTICRITDKEMILEQGLDYSLFIGRASEMKFLLSKLEDTASRRGDLVFITGDTGVGKTRLLVELAMRAREWGFTVIYGRAKPSNIGSSYTPFIDGIRTYLKEQRLCNGERLGKLFGVYAPQLARFFPEYSGVLTGEIKPIMPEHERQRLYEGVAQFLGALSQEAAVLLILDDLQWTSESDLDLVQYLGRTISQERLLICGACRAEETKLFSHKFAEALNRVKGEGIGHEQPLERLAREESDQLVERLLSRLKFPAALKDVVYNATRGNPLHIVEMIKCLVDEKVLTLDKKEWQLGDSIDIDWLKNIGSVIERRIGNLDGITDNVLSVASVIGETFDFEVVKKISNVNEGHLVEILDKAIDSRLVSDAPGSITSSYIFTHSFIQSKFYERLSEIRRRHFHAQIAAALEKVYADRLIEVYGELGWHYAESGNPIKAVEYSLKAARSLHDVYAYQEAIGYYRMAARIIEKYAVGSSKDKIEIYQGLGDIYSVLGEPSAAIESYQVLLGSDAPGLEPKEKSMIWFKIGRVHQKRAEYTEALSCYKLASSLLSEKDSWDELAKIKVVAAGIMYQKSQLDEALAELDEVLKKGGGDKSYVGEAYLIAGATYAKKLAMDKAMESYQKAMSVWEKLDDIYSMARTNNNIGTVLLLKGDDENAAKYFEMSLEFYEKIGDIFDKSAILNNVGLIYTNKEQWTKALSYFTEGLAIVNKVGNRHMAAYLLCNIGRIQLRKGYLGEAETSLKKAMTVAEEFGDKFILPIIYNYLSHCHLLLGDAKTAIDYLRQSQPIAQAAGQDETVLANNQLMAEIYLAQERVEEARKLCSSTIEEAAKLPNQILTAQILLTYGRIYLKLNNPAEADEVVDRAIKIIEGKNNEHLRGQALQIKAESMAMQGRKKERARLQDEAGKIFEKLGAMLDLKKMKEGKE